MSQQKPNEWSGAVKRLFLALLILFSGIVIANAVGATGLLKSALIVAFFIFALLYALSKRGA